MGRTPVVNQLRPHFNWPWFLTWTFASAFIIFLALKILSSQPALPFIIHPLADAHFSRLLLLVLIAVTVVYSICFLAVATLPGIGPHTSPAGRWLIYSFVLVLAMTAMFVAGSISPRLDMAGLNWLLGEIKGLSPSHDTIATVLVACLALALSTAAVMSNLAASLQGCSDEQIQTIKNFLIWMHATLAVIVLAYAALLFKTNIQLHPDGLFMWYFAALYLLISILIFFIPAVKFGLLSTQTVLSFAGMNLPPWILGLLTKIPGVSDLLR